MKTSALSPHILFCSLSLSFIHIAAHIYLRFLPTTKTHERNEIMHKSVIKIMRVSIHSKCNKKRSLTSRNVCVCGVWRKRNALRRNRCILERIDRRHMVDLEISFYFSEKRQKSTERMEKGRKKTDRNKELCIKFREDV